MAFNQQFKSIQNYLKASVNEYYIYDMLRYHTIGLNSRPNYVPLFYGQKYSKVPKKVLLFLISRKNRYSIIFMITDTLLSLYLVFVIII